MQAYIWYLLRTYNTFAMTFAYIWHDICVQLVIWFEMCIHYSSSSSDVLFALHKTFLRKLERILAFHLFSMNINLPLNIIINNHNYA